MPLFVGACVAAAPLPLWWILNGFSGGSGSSGLAVAFVCAFCCGALCSPTGPNVRYGISSFTASPRQKVAMILSSKNSCRSLKRHLVAGIEARRLKENDGGGLWNRAALHHYWEIWHCNNLIASVYIQVILEVSAACANFLRMQLLLKKV